MATIKGQMQHRSGIPLGGLGTGSVEIRPDGGFHEWQIFNLGAWAPQQPEGCKAVVANPPPAGLAFFVRSQEKGRPPMMRRLAVQAEEHDLYSFAWLKSVQEVEFKGAYPLTRLEYRDEGLPVAVSAEMFSPFIPHDARTSGTPGFHVVFRVRNRVDRPVTISLLGILKNPVAHGAADRKLVNRVRRFGDTTLLTMATEVRDAPCLPTLGSLSLSVTGGQASWIAGEYPEAFSGFVIHHWLVAQTPYGQAHESLLHDFRENGRLPSLPGQRSPSGLLRLTDAEIAALSRARQSRLLREVLAHPFVRSLWSRVALVDPALLRSRRGRAGFLKQVRIRLDRLAGNDRAKPWGDGALCSTLTLAPQEEREIRFALGWHFPRHYSARGPVIGHMYERWFRDAADVGRFLAASFEAHRQRVTAFADTLFDTTLPPEMPDAWAGQLTTLPKSTWWTRDGKFGVWEGLGCCGFHTTDITYQGSFNLLSLFPELQKSQMLMGARFQRADGRVPHYFTPDLSAVDNGFDRVDMNQQFVLLVCRDYLWTGDARYLRRLWPNIVRAMEATAQLDGDGDGLPDHDTRRNTYDAWDFEGTPAYIASLWISALLAGIRMAEDLGHAAQAGRWRQALKKGIAAFETKLWNGRYYSLWVNGAKRDECCMTDQIDGEWFTSLVGLGHCLPRGRILAALRAIVRHNFRPEEGLINAGYPPGRKPRFQAFHNLQAMAPWTGIEYAMASMLLDFGMVAEGLAVVRNIDERYRRAGRSWNHVECGNHYYRAMSSWALLWAATGFKVDLPRQSVRFAPVVGGTAFRAPWVAPSGWGRFVQTPARFEARCESGTLRFRHLRLNLERRPRAAALNGRALPARVTLRDAEFVTSFPRDVRLRAGDCLVVE